MTIIPTVKQRLANPSDLVDLAGVDGLTGISVSGGTVEIGGMARHAEVNASSEVASAISGARQTRRRHRRSAGAQPRHDRRLDRQQRPRGGLSGGGWSGLRATVHTNRRQIAGDDFFTGMFETALEPGELVTGVSFPVPSRAAYMKFPNPASRYAIVGVFVAATSGGPRVAVTGAGPCVFRVAAMEQALAGNFAPEAVADIKIGDDDLNSDIHASAEYRAHLVTVMAKRAVAQANG